MSLIELLKTARDTTDTNILSELSQHQSSRIRRVVARNSYSSLQTLQKLSFDPVMNVSYVAVNNPNNTIVQREFKETHPCVLCNQDETIMNCNNCKALQDYKVS